MNVEDQNVEVRANRTESEVSNTAESAADRFSREFSSTLDQRGSQTPSEHAGRRNSQSQGGQESNYLEIPPINSKPDHRQEQNSLGGDGNARGNRRNETRALLNLVPGTESENEGRGYGNARGNHRNENRALPNIVPGRESENEGRSHGDSGKKDDGIHSTLRYGGIKNLEDVQKPDIAGQKKMKDFDLKNFDLDEALREKKNHTGEGKKPVHNKDEQDPDLNRTRTLEDKTERLKKSENGAKLIEIAERLKELRQESANSKVKPIGPQNGPQNSNDSNVIRKKLEGQIHNGLKDEILQGNAIDLGNKLRKK